MRDKYGWRFKFGGPDICATAFDAGSYSNRYVGTRYVPELSTGPAAKSTLPLGSSAPGASIAPS
jgi:hypothetical protein